MRKIDMKMPFKGRNTGNLITLAVSIALVYLLVSIYFANHFLFNTIINGVDVSLKAQDAADDIIRSSIKDYKLQLIERNGEREEISGQEIGMKYNEKNEINRVLKKQSTMKWLSSLIKPQRYYVKDLFTYDKDALDTKISELLYLNKAMIEPQNVSFKYVNGSYEVIEEVYGNKINQQKLNEAIKLSILKGKRELDLNERSCYENPKYVLYSSKTAETKNLLNQYVSAKIVYLFSDKNETLDGNMISQWLSIDENLDVVIDEKAIMQYVQQLSKKYDTVGVKRKFRTSMGKMIEVEGGIYGWKIDKSAEAQALMQNIKLGEVLEKEPVYMQKALSRAEDDIGDTYVEINITRQHLWFYQDGELIARGAIVTGNPNRGNATKTGVFMLNYKEEGVTLEGPDYEAGVTYWMPFYGNIGIHDASWRHSFGGNIYKRSGTHGCVNVSLYLAKTIYKNIEEGTPIICYEEK